MEREDPAAAAERGQAGLVNKFLREARAAEPDASDAAIVRRAERARRAWMIRLGRKSGAARKAGGVNAAT
jgi:hypothetical protein